MNEVIISDNSVSRANQERIKQLIMHREFPWYFNDTTLSGYDRNKNDLFQWVHILQVNAKQKSTLKEPILKCLRGAIPELETHRLIRAKLNLNTPYKRGNIALKHTDCQEKDRIVYIYYVNDSDGPTILYTNKWRPHKVHPKQGRLLKMPSSLSHSGNLPYHNNTRIVLNLLFQADLNQTFEPLQDQDYEEYKKNL